MILLAGQAGSVCNNVLLMLNHRRRLSVHNGHAGYANVSSSAADAALPLASLTMRCREKSAKTMDFHCYALISNDVYRFPLISNDFHWFSMIFVDF